MAIALDIQSKDINRENKHISVLFLCVEPMDVQHKATVRVVYNLRH